VIYQGEDFRKNELCGVLDCNKNVEVCVVKRNNAMCVDFSKLNEIEGDKVFYGKHDNAHEHKTGEHHVKTKVHDYKNKTPKQTAYRHGQQPQKECSTEELKSVGGRLLQWFTDVHKVESAKYASLPKHHIRCREDVGWMFSQLDGDENGKLSIDELHHLEADQWEPCIKAFLDRCDVHPDDLISVDEWCDCFQWADDERHEPPCHKAQHSVDPHLLGAHVPRCDVDGYFRPLQCHEKECWCVDKWGREFDHSRTKNAKADCGQYADSDEDDLDSDEL
jgi:hypothetical protein